jgi:hypothetical protein
MMGDMAISIRDLRLSAMDLLRGTRPGWLPVEGRDDLVRVPEDEAAEMVNVLAMDAREYVDKAEIQEGATSALSKGFFLVTTREPATEGTRVAAESVARFGYMARMAEWERLAPARTHRGSMIASLRGAVVSDVADELEKSEDPPQSFYDVLGDVTAFYAAREPLDVPYDAPEGFVLMWTIPGTGGQVRALLRDKTLQMVLQPDGASLTSADGPIEGATIEDFQQVWKYGFLLRSFEEFFWEE